MKLRPTHLYITSTGSSLAGLTIGRKTLERENPAGPSTYSLKGIACGTLTGAHFEVVARLANGAAEILDLEDRVEEEEVELMDFAGEGYGILSEEAREAMLLLGQTEGVLVDPVYTAKGLAGLISDVRKGVLTDEATVIFVHTGGYPAIFAYEQEICRSFSYFDTASPENKVALAQ